MGKVNPVAKPKVACKSLNLAFSSTTGIKRLRVARGDKQQAQGNTQAPPIDPPDATDLEVPLPQVFSEVDASPPPSDSEEEECESESEDDDEEPGTAAGPALPLAYSEELARAYLTTFAEGGDVTKSLLTAQAACLAEAVSRACAACPECGASPTPAGRVPIVIITWEQPVGLSVQQWRCSACNCRFAPRPTAAACYPDFSVAWDLTAWRAGMGVVWWSQQVLQMNDNMCFHCRSMSVDGFCAALEANWEQNSAPRPPGLPVSLNKRMRQALLTYFAVRGYVEDYTEGIVGWPRGALNACPCCGDAGTLAGILSQVRQQAAPGGSAGEQEEGGGPAGPGGQPPPPPPPPQQQQAAPGGSAGEQEEGGGVRRVTRLQWVWALLLSGAQAVAERGPPAFHSLHFDCNFKLDLLSWKSYTADYAQVPRRRFWLRNSDVKAALEDHSANLKIGTNHCSTFHADKVVAKASAQVCRAAAMNGRAALGFKLPPFDVDAEADNRRRRDFMPPWCAPPSP